MKLIASFICFLLILCSCTKNNPDPSWLVVNKWQLVVNPNMPDPSVTGVLTENITNAWVYVDNELLGVFEVPFKIPVLKEGNSEITVYPAILNNGIAATKKIYPFLEPYTITGELIKNQDFVVSPVTMYKTSVNFWVEDFDDANPKLEDGPSSLASLTVSNDASVFDPNINGIFFGRINLDDVNNLWVGSTVANQGSLVMDLPSGKEVYLEIDYHNTNRLLTGVLAIEATGVTDNPNILINPQGSSEVVWKKIYIELREIISGSPNAQYFEFSFQAILDEQELSGEVNIDNIKAVYF